MPSFDFTSEADMVALKNAIDVTSRQIDNRYDFKGTSAKVELEREGQGHHPVGRFRLPARPDQGSSFPAMEKKEKESVKRLDHQKVISVSGNKVKQDMKIKDGIDSDLAKKIVKLVKDGKLKVQASIQGDTVRVRVPSAMILQGCIALITKIDHRFSDQVRQFPRLSPRFALAVLSRFQRCSALDPHRRKTGRQLAHAGRRSPICRPA